MTENSTPPAPDSDGWVAQDNVVAYIAGIVGRSWVALYKEKNRIRQMLKYERRNDRLRFCHNQQNVLMVNASDVYRLFKRKFSECADIDFPLE